MINEVFVVSNGTSWSPTKFKFAPLVPSMQAPTVQSAYSIAAIMLYKSLNILRQIQFFSSILSASSSSSFE